VLGFVEESGEKGGLVEGQNRYLEQDLMMLKGRTGSEKGAGGR